MKQNSRWCGSTIEDATHRKCSTDDRPIDRLQKVQAKYQATSATHNTGGAWRDLVCRRKTFPGVTSFLRLFGDLAVTDEAGAKLVDGILSRRHVCRQAGYCNADAGARSCDPIRPALGGWMLPAQEPPTVQFTMLYLPTTPSSILHKATLHRSGCASSYPVK